MALARAGVSFTGRPYHHDPAAPSYGLEAGKALGVLSGRVFKTQLVDTGGGLTVGTVPVDRQLDLNAVATALGVKKVAMADTAAAERRTGYVVGGISPIGQKRPLPTVVDTSALKHGTSSSPAGAAASTSSWPLPTSSGSPQRGRPRSLGDRRDLRGE